MRVPTIWAPFFMAASLSLLSGCSVLLDFNTTDGGGGNGAAAGHGQAGNGADGGGGGTTSSCTAVCCANEDCPAPSDACKQPVCQDGACIEKDVDPGKPASVQAPGDCKLAVCDGMGGLASQPDDTDIPAATEDCKTTACEAGEPKTSNAAAGAACDENNGNVCDGSGVCVGCLVPSDCPANAPYCVQNVCVDAACMDGMKNGTETDVDCGGSCAPCGDGDSCSTGTDCINGICQNNVCKAASCSDGVKNGTESDVDCGGTCGNTCDPNETCNTNADCKGNQCSGSPGFCVPNCADQTKNNAESDVDCGGGTCGACGVGSLCAGQDANCVAGAYCSGGVCAAKSSNGTPCAAPNQCTTGICVDGVCCASTCGGTCLSCNVPGSAGGCVGYPSGLDPENECVNGACNGGGACALDNGMACMTAGGCLSGNCADGVCCNTACNGTCQSCNQMIGNGTCTAYASGTDPENECMGVVACNGMNGCSALANGSACSADGECQSGQCTDGVCCNAACAGTCAACDLAGSVGTCTNIPSNQDPDNECAGTEVCNGNGACKKVTGSTCGANNECLSSNCIDGVCCSATCAGLCKACNLTGSVGTCTNIPSGQDPASECSGASTCNGAGACTLLANGSTCGGNGECASNHCVDGFCCDLACNGLCESCNGAKTVGGVNGACDFIDAGTDPDNECVGICCDGVCSTIMACLM